LTELETQLTAPELYESDNRARLQTLLQTQGQAQQQLATLEEEWLMVSEEIEAAS
jgi:hypothetical protein